MNQDVFGGRLTPRPLASRYSRRVAKESDAKQQLAKRTLTNFYNHEPEWLQQAHRRLDGAIFAAYGWDTAMSDDDLLAALLS